MSGYYKKVEDIRTSQPEVGVGVNPKWVEDEGLVALFDGRQGMELISGDRATSNTTAYGTGAGGVAADFSSTANQQYAHRPAYAILGPITIVVFCDVGALTNYGALIAKEGNTLTNQPYELRVGSAATDSKINFSRANAGIKTWAGGANQFAAPFSSGIIAVSSNSGLIENQANSYVNNTKLALTGSGTGSGAVTDNGSSVVWIGRRYDGATQLAGKIYYTALFNHALDDAKLKEIVENKWCLYEPEVQNVWVPVGGGGGPVSKALTGQGVAVAQGSIAALVQYTLSGQSVSAAQGNISAAVSYALTGQSLSLAQGTVSVAGGVTAALTGQGISIAHGNLSAAVTAALTGQAVYIAQGSVSASTGGVVAALTGQNLSIAQGSLLATVTKALTGQAVTIAQGSVAVAGSVTTATTLVITKITGTFSAGTIKVGGVSVGTCTGAQTVNGASTAKLRAQYTNLAADVYRALITAVPGSGRVLGVWMYNNIVYAFRNAADGLSAVMHKSSASGWQTVSLGRELSFTSGGTFNISVGDTITGETSGATAIITGITIESGTLAASTAAGRIIFASQTGTFGTETIKVGANLNVANISGNSTAITFAAPNGRFSFGNFNFGSGTKMYGADGKNRGFEFDGTTFVPIVTGMVPDTPLFVREHKNHLFYSFIGSAQHSGIGAPYIWTIISGAAELAMGDTIAGFQVQAGGESGAAMTIFTRNRIKTLYGSSAADWNLVGYREEAGAFPYTIQQIGGTLMLDDRGITSLVATQEYGNFADATLTKRIQSWINQRRSISVDSCLARDKNQYRLFFSDGSALYTTMDNGKPVGMLPVLLPNVPTCVSSLENNSGDELIFFGSDDGFVYQMDVGTSFDGADIDFYMDFAYNNIGSPRVLKTFKNGVLEVSGNGYSEFSYSYRLSYGSTEVEQPSAQLAASSLTTGSWDTGSWDQFVWDGLSLLPSYFPMQGEGENISISILGASDFCAPLRFSGAQLSYIMRRALR